MTRKAAAGARLPAVRALRIAGWANLAIAAAHIIGLLWAWSMFRSAGIEEDMRELAKQGAALPHIFTLITAAAFFIFGLYALSGAGDLRRLPLLAAALASIAAIYVYRATLYGGISAVRDGDGTQIAFAAIAALIGLCYAYGAVAHRRLSTQVATAPVDVPASHLEGSHARERDADAAAGSDRGVPTWDRHGPEPHSAVSLTARPTAPPPGLKPEMNRDGEQRDVQPRGQHPVALEGVTCVGARPVG